MTPAAAAELARAEKLQMAGQVGEALNIYAALLARDPRDVEALYMKGVALLRAGEAAQGEQALQAALALAPGIADCGHLDAMYRRLKMDSPADIAYARYQQFRALQNTDVFILSYPKCGRTWLRLLLGKYLQQQFGLREDGMILELHALTWHIAGLPRVDFSHDDYPQLKPAAEIEHDKRRYSGKKVVFLVRDPRDVLVSYYFQYTRRGAQERAGEAPFTGTMSDFLRHPIGGIDNIIAFYNVWAAQRATPADFMLLRYEDMHAQPLASLRRLIDFIGFPATADAKLEQVLAFGSFDNMKRIERGDLLKSPRLGAAAPDDPESFKVRKGRVAGYGEYLTAEDVAFLDQKIAGLDDLYAGYKTRP
jgi:hypothetical protein